MAVKLLLVGDGPERSRLEKLIQTQSEITLLQNKKKIGSIEYVLIEKESKKSENFWPDTSQYFPSLYKKYIGTDIK